MTHTTTWKEFNKNELTHSGAHYLMAIHEVHEEQGYARLSDIAKKLNLSKGSLSMSLKPLIKKNLILEDKNKHLSLSDSGKILAKNIENTCATIQHFLQTLGVSQETANIDACKVEHLLSNESSSMILKLVKSLEENPKLFKELQNEMNKHSQCSVKGCRVCKSEKFCLAQNMAKP